MAESFNRVQRESKSNFKEFCFNNFGEKIGMSIYSFIMKFSKKRMDMFSDVTPESQRRIVFVKYLFNNYGLNNLLTGIDIFYKQMRLNNVNFEKQGYKYFKAIVTTPKPDLLKNCDESIYPDRMSSDAQKKFKKVTNEFREAFNYYKENKKDIDYKLAEVWEGDSKKVEDKKEDVINHVYIEPIQLGHLGTHSFTEHENYSYQCPLCNHVNKHFNFECSSCYALFNFKKYKK